MTWATIKKMFRFKSPLLKGDKRDACCDDCGGPLDEGGCMNAQIGLCRAELNDLCSDEELEETERAFLDMEFEWWK